MSAVAPLQASAKMDPEKRPGLPFPDNLVSNLSADEVERYAYVYRPADPLFGRCVELLDDAQQDIAAAEENTVAVRDEFEELEHEHDKLAREVDDLKARGKNLLAVLREEARQHRLDPMNDYLTETMDALSEAVR